MIDLADTSSEADGGPDGSVDAAARAGDAELVAAARSGDRRALHEIYRAHRSAIGRHLLVLTRDAAAVDDLVHDTFVIGFRQLDRYTGNSRLGTWLHGIALNVARNHRAKYRRRRGLLDRLLRPAGDRPDHAARAPLDAADGLRASPEGELMAKEAVEALYRALDGLPHEQREAYVLRVVEEIPLKEAAIVLGAPIATVSYRARQAEQHVRAALAQIGVRS